MIEKISINFNNASENLINEIAKILAESFINEKISKTNKEVEK